MTTGPRMIGRTVLCVALAACGARSTGEVAPAAAPPAAAPPVTSDATPVAAAAPDGGVNAPLVLTVRCPEGCEIALSNVSGSAIFLRKRLALGDLPFERRLRLFVRAGGGEWKEMTGFHSEPAGIVQSFADLAPGERLDHDLDRES